MDEPFVVEQLMLGKLHELLSRRGLPWTSKLRTTQCRENGKPCSDTETRRNMIQREWPDGLRADAIIERKHNSCPARKTCPDKENYDESLDDFRVW